jgi:NADH-quinone oxidoreductase subunit M
VELTYLSAIVFLPALGAVVISLLSQPSPRLVRFVAAFFTLVSLVFSLRLFAAFDRSAGGWYEGNAGWLPASLPVNFHLGVDGLSLPLVVLTGFLGFLVVLISWKVELRVKEYFIWLLLLETGIMGVFASADLLLFFLFWEVELIPMYLLISIWGSGRKEYSAIKFVVFTLFGSAFMLAGILALYFSTGTFNLHELAAMDLGGVSTVLPLTAIFLFIFLAFAVKLPMFPLHTWLPDAHTDAPTAVSVILAGALLKMGGYGIIRINVGLFPQVARDLAPYIAALAVVSIIYGAAITIRQKDLKRMIAYSSVSHMGYVLLGVFALSQISMTGAALQMVSHGFVTGLLFAMVGLVYDKTHNRNLDFLGGLARQMPVIAVVFTIAGLASLGLPGTSGFAAEVIVFLGSFSSTAFEAVRLYTVLGVGAIVLTAGYILWMLQRTFYTEPLEKYDGVPDADALEKVSIFTFVAAIMVIGIYPGLVTDVLKLGVPALGF